MNKQRFAFGTIGGLALSLVMAAALLAPAAAVSQTLGVASQPEATRPSRLVLLSKLDGPPLPADLLVLEDYDAFVLAEVSEAQLAALPEANVMDRMADRTVISLNGTVWDTRQGEPAVPDDLRAADDDPYFLIQFYAPVKNEWVTGLEALGVTFLGYHPNYTYIVRMDPALMPRVQAAHAVQWVGRYHPAYRLAPEEEIAKALAYDGRIALVVRGFPGMDVAVLRVGLEKASASVWLVESLEPPVVRVWAAPELLAQLAALPGVYWIEAYDPPELHNDKAAQTMDTWNVWRAGRNGLLQDLMGAGQIAGMVDSGLDNKSTNPTIEDFYDYTGGTTTSRVVYNQNGAGCGGFCPCTTTDNLSGHGTHVAGSIVGNGYNSLAQRGLTAYATAADPSFDYAWAVGQAPEARIAVIHAGGTSGGICVSAQTDWVNLYNQGARNVNNSWGNTFYYYGGNSRTADYVMWIYQDYLVVTSAGNAGQATNTLSQPANAKNTVTVGAALNHRSPWILTSEASNLLTYFSSRGPV
ncbi:MAG: S8 family serine peptidase, partial [Anaerolineae bacterium]|nr:S8 family serine peptidase [Anaerolineae bacterium]